MKKESMFENQNNNERLSDGDAQQLEEAPPDIDNKNLNDNIHNEQRENIGNTDNDGSTGKRSLLCLYGDDKCICSGCCVYPNGLIQVLLAQFFSFIAFSFAVAALTACHFVKANVSMYVDKNSDKMYYSINNDNDDVGLGFYSYENNSSECTWAGDEYDDEQHHNYHQNLHDEYISFLGNGWHVGRSSGMITCMLSFILWCFIMSFTCVSYPKSIRYLVGILYMVPLVILQGLTFTVMASSFCDKVDCDFDSSAGLSIGALLGFFLSGIFFFFMKDSRHYQADG